MTTPNIDPANLTEDDSYVNNYVVANTPGNDDKARLKQVVNEIGGVSDDSGATDDDTAIASFLASENVNPAKLSKNQRTAEALAVQTEKARLLQERRDLLASQKLREKEMSTQQRLVSMANDKAVTPLLNGASSAVQKISSLPTVGSIGLLLALLIILLFVVVNVDGKGTTRLKQLWFMLNGRATLNNRVSPTKGSQTGTTKGADLPGVNNGSSTGQGNGTLPGAGTRTGTTNTAQFTKDNANLMKDLTIGNGNLDIIDQWGALNADFAVQQDVSQNASSAKVQSDLNTLHTSLNKLNDPMYNSDYLGIFHDLGF